MKKLILCKIATIVCGLLAIAIHARPDRVAEHWQNNKLIGAALGLLCAIFGTQWVEYQKRQDAASAQPAWPTWLRRLFFSIPFCLAVMTALTQLNNQV